MATNTHSAPNAHKTSESNAPPFVVRKENILDLDKYIDHSVCVKFRGGRQVHGTLKGYDQLVNLVLDECIEFLREDNDSYRLSDKTRSIGLVVCRGTTVMLISPVDGTEEIANPFIQQEE
uniref:U6 snRNAassociated Smlike protein putative n=1 Tax=Albugo laibachii Nc14 TaxID=890382 RepID=F0WMT1_9STRA|nr:U6 snRNAassociated Smlike protein putative [Albugo laibachii Nc14]|eukprot:CCA22616.1 U6 snRNAassociated Smlike protein putative [Albugo laibachii Nc14]